MMKITLKYIISFLMLGLLVNCSSKYIEKSSVYQELKKERERDKSDAMNYKMRYESIRKELKDSIKALEDLRADCQKENLNNKPTTSSNQLLIPKPNPSNSQTNTKKQNKKIDENSNESFRIVKSNKDEFVVYKVINPKSIEFFLNDTSGNKMNSFENIKKNNLNRKMIFGMNAGIFKPGYIPEGLFVSNAKEITAVNNKQGKGNFYTSPNGIFYINKNNKADVVTTGNYLSLSDLEKDNIENATQSGPMLVIDGAVNKKFNKTSSSKHIRNAVGVDDKGHVYFVISTQRVNLFSISDLFLNHLDCKNALYLDGAISKAYIPDQNRKSLYGNFGPMMAVFKNQ